MTVLCPTGHAASWQAGYPEIMADCFNKYTNVNNYALNPTLPETYTVLTGVLSDIVKATGAAYLHIGKCNTGASIF